MDWLWWVQLGADGLLLVAIVLLMMRMKSGGGRGGEVTASAKDLEKFLAEAAALGQDFDRLLNEKRELMASTLSTLDKRLETVKSLIIEAEDVAKALNQAQNVPAAQVNQATQAASISQPVESMSFRQQAKLLASQGKSKEEIAEITDRPIGEVELILGLSGQEG